jgi:hypothetical protein
MMAIVSLDSPSCEVPCLILLSVVYRHITRQAKGLHRLKYHWSPWERGLAFLSRCNSDWFCHRNAPKHEFWVQWSGLGAFVAKKFRRDFVYQTCALMAPVWLVLHRLLCTNETIRNDPKRPKTWVLDPMEWIRCVRCEKSQRKFI